MPGKGGGQSTLSRKRGENYGVRPSAKLEGEVVRRIPAQTGGGKIRLRTLVRKGGEA